MIQCVYFSHPLLACVCVLRLSLQSQVSEVLAASDRGDDFRAFDMDDRQRCENTERRTKAANNTERKKEISIQNKCFDGEKFGSQAQQKVHIAEGEQRGKELGACVGLRLTSLHLAVLARAVNSRSHCLGQEELI